MSDEKVELIRNRFWVDLTDCCISSGNLTAKVEAPIKRIVKIGAVSTVNENGE